LWSFTASVTGTYQVCAVVEDACEAKDTVCLTYNIVINSDPQITFTSSDKIFLCGGEEICLVYTTADVDDNITLEEMLTGAGSIDTLANQICFNADTAGSYFFTIAVTDECSATDQDTMTVIVELNSPPVASAGEDQSVFQCAPEEICWTAGCTDPDDNLDSCKVIAGPANYDGEHICLTPDTTGVYTVVLRAVDVCGAFDQDTVLVEVLFNSPPNCSQVPDSIFFQCLVGPISIPLDPSDDDDNLDYGQLVSGPGSIVDGVWHYTPVTNETHTVIYRFYDECEEFCEDTFMVDIVLNSPPVVDSGNDTTYFFCNSGETICWPVSATDPDNNLLSVNLISPHGTYNETSEEICFVVPSGDKYYDFVLEAIDSCGVAVQNTVRITINFNSPPVLELPSNQVVFINEPGEVCIDIIAEDPDNNLLLVDVFPIGEYDYDTGEICFYADTMGTYCLNVTVTDICNVEVTDTVCIEIEIDECLHVQIEKTHNTIQGQHETVSVLLNGSGKELGGYDMLIAYDLTALTVASVTPGQLLEDCDWEYFNYRHGADGNCGNACPSGLLRIIAIAETNNGAYHPGCFLNGLVGTLADISFLVTDDRTFECMYAPVQFFWMDCGDNAFSSKYGDTLWISRSVFDFEGGLITDYQADFPTYLGAPTECTMGGGPGKPASIRCIDFTNGGIDIICADSIDGRGDINLNGVLNEIADAVLFANYFLQGLSVFTVNVDGQIAATDVNADGLTLSVADLVYLIRIVIGDAIAIEKISPNETVGAELTIAGDLLSVTSTDLQIGAMSIVLEGEVTPRLHKDAIGMTMQYNYDGINTRVLVYDPNGRVSLATGSILHLGGSESVKSVDIGSFNGIVITTKIHTLPTEFHLSQNYPNPFNPITTFEFGLPVASEWDLTVYNILGQTVKTFSGESEAGYVKLQWNASAHASGVYFYRLQVMDFTTTKKMLLLK